MTHLNPTIGVKDPTPEQLEQMEASAYLQLALFAVVGLSLMIYFYRKRK